MIPNSVNLPTAEKLRNHIRGIRRRQSFNLFFGTMNLALVFFHPDRLSWMNGVVSIASFAGVLHGQWVINRIIRLQIVIDGLKAEIKKMESPPR